MAALSRERALYLLANANNHGDLSVKLSSLSQVRDILLAIEPSYAAEIFPYLIELQASPESLVRKLLIEVIEDVGLKAVEQSSLLMSVLLLFLNDGSPIVARQSIISGTNLFCSVLGEMALQFHRWGRVERWLEELWTWMIKFKDAVFAIALEPGSIGKRLLALKFLETYVILFTSEATDSEKPASEATERSKQAFNISWLVGGYPVLDPVVLMSDANRTISILLNLLRSANSLPGPLTITVVSCLASIARKRPVHYNMILSQLLDFDPNFESMKGCHAPSIQYSLRTAFLGFLRSTYPSIVESRERLLRALRAMNAGDAADQVIRQVGKMIKGMDRAPRDTWSNKDDAPSTQFPILADLSRKRLLPPDNEEPANGHEMTTSSKHIRFGADINLTSQARTNDIMEDYISNNGEPPDIPMLDGALTPVEQMIAMIGALLAEGERGAESLEILVSQIHPDMLADIVITNMKHLPKAPPSLTRLGDLPTDRQASVPGQVVGSSASNDSVQSPVLTAQLPVPLGTAGASSLSDSTTVSILDSKRDPRRDPRRLDPRRLRAPSISFSEDAGLTQTDIDGSISKASSVTTVVESPSTALLSKLRSEDKVMENTMVSGINQLTPKIEVLEESEEIITVLETNASSDHVLSSVQEVNKELLTDNSIENPVTKADDISSFMDSDQHSPSVSNASTSEETCQELPLLPSYVELTSDQQRDVKMLAVERIIDSCKNLCGMDWQQLHSALLARLFAQIDADDNVVGMLQKHAVLDYQQQRGHELVLHVLYHLHSLAISDSVDGPSLVAVVYEKFFSAVAKSLLESFPASDKSFSRLLGEVPVVPDSVLQLLDDLCFSDVTDNHGKELRDVERVTQGLGTVWNLIVKRPLNRQTYLDIALKCAVHPQDEIRSTAIRLVANKLYQLSYVSDNIEKHATDMLLSAIDAEVKVESQETSISGAEGSEPGTSENETMRSSQTMSHGSSSLSFSEAQRLISLFFALCIKKPTLLQLVFQTYGRAPKAVKQAVHRHMPILIRALGSSYSELLGVISDPPQGSEHLLTLVLQILTQETTPTTELISTVKHLYETKLKDVTILIPMLSSLSKTEDEWKRAGSSAFALVQLKSDLSILPDQKFHMLKVLPIFPRLLDLPLEKFQTALAHILQGSAHTGPALTPAEVLVAIHAIIPEKDGIALKKITDACSACFEQRTVFTQQVLAKALNQMVDQTPLPLLFMRTVIQAIDAFPSLVDFVMEVLSKLVNKQVWRMPKLWFGFLKCAFQTQPHSFQVLLQLPPAQLENALNKYPNLRSSLASYASQPSIKSSLSRATLAVLGFQKELLVQQPHSSSLYSSDTNSSVRGSTLT